MTKPIKDYNTLQIEINHSHGGYNYFSNIENNAGMFIHFRPIKILNGISSFILFEDDNLSFKIQLDDKYRLNRKNKEKYEQILKENKEKLLELYETNIKALYRFIKETFKV